MLIISTLISWTDWIGLSWVWVWLLLLLAELTLAKELAHG